MSAPEGVDPVALVAAIRDINRVAVSHDDVGEGWVTRYTMPVGPLHRALGLISGQPDPSADEECICTPGPGGVHDHCRYARHGSHPSDPQRWCDLCWDDLLAVPRPDRLSEEERALMKRAMVYRDRCAAVEKLLACYRTQSQPSERLHRELARTKRAIDRLALDPEKE